MYGNSLYRSCNFSPSLEMSGNEKFQERWGYFHGCLSGLSSDGAAKRGQSGGTMEHKSSEA